MMLRFRYGNVNDEYEYQDNQLQAMDSYLDEDQIRQRFAYTYRNALHTLTEAVKQVKDARHWIQ